MKGRGWAATAGVAVLLAGVQIGTRLAGCEYYLTQMIMAAYTGIVVMGLCLVMGYAGQISLGHGAFVAIGGYTSAVLTTWDWSGLPAGAWIGRLERTGLLQARTGLYGDPLLTVHPWGAFCCGVLLAAGVAVLIGYPALRLKGHYLAMATLGFGLIVYRLVLGTEFLGAADGIHGVPDWPLAPGLRISGGRADRVANYYIAWGLALGILLVLSNIVRSRLGRALRSIHGSEAAANAMGVNTAGYKLRVFVLSAVLAAAAGSLMTHYYGGIGPSEAGAVKSVRYVALVAAGGMANLPGVLSVSAALTFLSLRGVFGSLDDAVFGAILIAIISWAPGGPFAPVRAWFLRRRREQAV